MPQSSDSRFYFMDIGSGIETLTFMHLQKSVEVVNRFVFS